MSFRDIKVGDVVFRPVSDWIFARKQVYRNYRELFAPSKLQDLTYVTSEFRRWLSFRNNMSWTILQRTGYRARLKYLDSDLVKVLEEAEELL